MINDKIYIGSTKQCFRVRLNNHLQALRKNNHKNCHLQHAWNKYGENSFEFTILKICTKDDTYAWEQKFLDERNKQMSYNINPNATGPSQVPESIRKCTNSKIKFLKNVFRIIKNLKTKKLNLMIYLKDSKKQF